MPFRYVRYVLSVTQFSIFVKRAELVYITFCTMLFRSVREIVSEHCHFAFWCFTFAFI